MRAKEESLRVERGGVVVQQPAQVIVLSDIRDLEHLDSRISPEHPSTRPRRSRR